MNYDVVIVASGKAKRAELGYNKAFYLMKDGKTVLQHSINLFKNDNDCKKIIVVTSEEYFDRLDDDDVVKVQGGQYRKDSVFNGLIKVESEYVFVHDGARPFLRKENIEQLKEKLVDKDAVILGHMCVDTVKKIEQDRIVETIDRNQIFLAETPQAFKTSLLKECYERCDDVAFTDEASLVESLGYDVYVVNNLFNNQKLTVLDDFNNL